MYMQANYNVRSIECAMLRRCEQICNYMICFKNDVFYAFKFKYVTNNYRPGKYSATLSSYEKKMDKFKILGTCIT